MTTISFVHFTSIYFSFYTIVKHQQAELDTASYRRRNIPYSVCSCTRTALTAVGCAATERGAVYCLNDAIMGCLLPQVALDQALLEDVTLTNFDVVK